MSAPLAFHSVLDSMFDKLLEQEDGPLSITARVMDTDPNDTLPPFELTLNFENVEVPSLKPGERHIGIERLDIENGKATRTVLA